LRQVKRLFFTRAIFIAGMFFIQAIQSSVAQKTDIEVGVGLMAFDYAEYDDDNIFLDGETGLIPGIVIKVKTKKNIYAEWVGSLYYNQIKYDGETQITAIPITSRSEALIMDTYVKFGKSFDVSYQRNQSLYIGLGYRYWFRNILPTVIDSPGSPDDGKTVAGLLEEYHWYYTLLGYQVNFNASDKVQVGFDLRLTHMFNAKIDIDHLGFGGYDNNTLDLGNEAGARFAMPVEIKMSKSIFFVTPYYEIIDIGKSNSAIVTVGGVPINRFIQEPRSETRNVGIELTWVW